MRSSFRPLVLVAALVGMATLAQAAPGGWILGGKRSEYEAGSDKAVKHSGQASGYLKSKVAHIDGFGTLRQTIFPSRYAGKRLRLSAAVKTDHVASWAGLWLRIDGDNDRALAFDNMENRAIRGTTDWKVYEVVLDVSKDARAIAFGVLLSGTGALWIDDVELETVSPSVPITSDEKTRAPENLDFEKD